MISVFFSCSTHTECPNRFHRLVELYRRGRQFHQVLYFTNQHIVSSITEHSPGCYYRWVCDVIFKVFVLCGWRQIQFSHSSYWIRVVKWMSHAYFKLTMEWKIFARDAHYYGSPYRAFSLWVRTMSLLFCSLSFFCPWTFSLYLWY